MIIFSRTPQEDEPQIIGRAKFSADPAYVSGEEEGPCPFHGYYKKIK